MVAEAHRRLAGVFRTSQMFAEASDEKRSSSWSCSFLLNWLEQRRLIRVAGRARTGPSGHERWRAAYPESDAWVEYLASPAVRQKCTSCQNKEQLTLVCPLLKGSFLGTMGIYCLPLRRGEHEFGVLNLYVPQPGGLDSETQAILRRIAEETILTMESVRLRKRELTTLLNYRPSGEDGLKTLLSSLI
jgi:GAF domain-containing protein